MMTNYEIFKLYFSGDLDKSIAYFKQSNSDYAIENHKFLMTIKTTLDPFVSTLTPELQDMYYQKYIKRVPFQRFYNVTAPTEQIIKLNSQLNALVKSIKQPERFQ